MALPLPWQEVNQISLSQQTPNILPSQASYGVSIVRIEEKFDRVVMAPRCTYKLGLSLKTMEQSRRHMDSRVTCLRALCILSVSLMEDEIVKLKVYICHEESQTHGYPFQINPEQTKYEI